MASGSPSPARTNKVLAYVTQLDRLLVFTHRDSPEAGLQVPAGTMRDGEPPAVAVLREAEEETGVADLRIRARLGVTRYDMAGYGRNEIQTRHVYHLVPVGKLPDTWSHFETHDGLAAPELFDFSWMTFKEAAERLEGGQGALLVALADQLHQGVDERLGADVIRDYRARS